MNPDFRSAADPTSESRESPEILALEAALASLAPLFIEGARLPAPDDLLRRARIRQRELAAARLARFMARTRLAGAASLGSAAVGIAFATRLAWTGWLADQLRGVLLVPRALPASGDAAVIAGAVLAASVAAIWVLQRFAEE